MENNINFTNINLSDEDIKKITEAVTQNFNKNQGVRVSQESKGTLKVTLNDNPYELNDQEIEALRLFLDSMLSTYEVLKGKNENNS